MSLPEQIIVGRAVGHRYRGADPDHVLVVDSETIGHVPHFEQFCTHHAAQGVDVWSLGVPEGPRLSPDGWAEWMFYVGNQTATRAPRLPVFIMGFSLSGAVAYHRLLGSDIFWGAVLIDCFDRDYNAFSMRRQTLNGFTSASCLRIVGEDDAWLQRQLAKAVGAGADDGADMYVHRGDLTELANSPVDFSNIVLDWCVRQLGNHLNPKWWIKA